MAQQPTQGEQHAMNAIEYNGWTNYETWLANLWLSNDQYTIEFITDTWTKHLMPEAIEQELDDQDLVEIMSHLISNTLEEMTELGTGASLATDLINAALGEVNTREIAHALIEWGDVEDTRQRYAEAMEYDNRPTLITD
jgi:hypothetical protein